MPKINNSNVTIYLTPNCKITKSALKIGETHAGFDMKGFDLAGKTGVKNRSYYTEGLLACTGGIFIGKLLNMFHENSSIYKDAEGTKYKIFEEISKKIIGVANNTKENIQAFLFGGWGYGSNKNTAEVEKSHNLFNNIALCIEEKIPEKEGVEIPLTTIWGKLDSSKPDKVYVRDNTIVLENDIFRELFKNNTQLKSKQELIDFLEEHYEEVQIPDNVNIIAKATYEPTNNIFEINKLKKANLNFIV